LFIRIRKGNKGRIARAKAKLQQSKVQEVEGKTSPAEEEEEYMNNI
jgi:hypothetical protein